MDVTIEAPGENMNGKESTIREILQEFKDVINMPIAVSNPHGKHAEPYTGTDKLQIYFWSSAQRESSQITILSQIFGLSPEGYGAEDALKPSSGPMIHHIKSPEGIIVAEVNTTHPNTLYILFDLPHQPQSYAKIHLREIMNIFCVDFWFHQININIADIKVALEKARRNKMGSLYQSIISQKIFFGGEKESDIVKKPNHIDNLVALDCQKKYASELDKINKEAIIAISDQRIIISVNKNDQIIMSPLFGFYAVSIGKTSIPFEEICNGPAKSGLAQLLGRDELYSAYQIINRWLKNYKGGR